LLVLFQDEMHVQTSTDEGTDPYGQRIASHQDHVPSSQAAGVEGEHNDLNNTIFSGRPDQSLESTPSTLHGEDVEKTAPDSGNVVQTQKARPDLVEFDGPDDPGNPKNWSRRKRWVITAVGSILTFSVTFSSSIFSVAINPVAKEYNIGTVTSTLGVSLFLFGFVLGPIIFGPMSEAYGRKIPLLSGYAVFAIFQIPVAVAQNVETIMLGRFFGGFAASSPLAVVGGLMADIWEPIDRAYAICCFASGGFAGPVVSQLSFKVTSN